MTTASPVPITSACRRHHPPGGRRTRRGRHADDSVELIDLGSADGTYVNGQRITLAMLTEQDTIDIGHTRFQLADGELRPCAD
jgi:pSer/pThr/pTyr-binding forkhead associated (FHA) protein